MILIEGVGLLLLAFIVHIIVWRYKKPLAVNRGLLIIFILVPAIVLPLQGILFDIHFLLPELVSLGMLYISCALVYIILYSAIEMQSPTLAIIDLINQNNKFGCHDCQLQEHLTAENAMQLRIAAMEQNNWVILDKCSRWQLTSKGRRIAKIFHFSAAIFGLTKGG